MIENPGMKIRNLRELKGYTQDNMAAELSISGKAYQKIESGETQLSILRLNEISEVLEIGPIDILEFDESNIFKKSLHQENKILGQVNSIDDFSSVIQSKDELISNLQSEVDFLKKIISKNMNL